jgi:hypothetical protein
MTATVDQETYSDQVTINGTVANSTPQPVAITPLRVYPLGSVQVDLSAWAIYGTQMTPAPIVIAPGQTVAFKVHQGVAHSYYATISSWVFNPGFTQVAFADASYAGVCSVEASWGNPVENH